MRKRILPVVLCILIALSFVGCDNSANLVSPEPSQSPTGMSVYADLDEEVNMKGGLSFMVGSNWTGTSIGEGSDTYMYAIPVSTDSSAPLGLTISVMESEIPLTGDLSIASEMASAVAETLGFDSLSPTETSVPGLYGWGQTDAVSFGSDGKKEAAVIIMLSDLDYLYTLLVVEYLADEELYDYKDAQEQIARDFYHSVTFDGKTALA